MKLSFNIGIMIGMLSFVFGCSSFGYQSPRYVKIANEITLNTAIKLEKQKELHLIGTGGGMMDDIQAMHMSFQFFHEVSLEEARDLLVYAVREYLSNINNSEEVRPYLRNYPFTAKNVEIRIWVYNPDRSEVSLDKIEYISITKGVIDYYIRGLEGAPHKTICEETYEEALKLVGSP